jgi:hypothetical protein
VRRSTIQCGFAGHWFEARPGHRRVQHGLNGAVIGAELKARVSRKVSYADGEKREMTICCELVPSEAKISHQACSFFHLCFAVVR